MNSIAISQSVLSPQSSVLITPLTTPLCALILWGHTHYLFQASYTLLVSAHTIDAQEERRPRWGTPWALGVVVGLVLILVITGVVMELFGRAAQERLAQANRLLILERTAYGCMVDMQAAARGYVLTRDEALLVPYNDARAKLPAIWSEMEALAAGIEDLPANSVVLTQTDRTIRDLTIAVKFAADTWLLEVGEPLIQQVRDGRTRDEIAAAGFNLAYFTAFREATNQLVQLTQTRLAMNARELDLARQVEVGLLVVLGLLASGSGIVAIRLSRLETNQQEAARLQAEAERKRLLTVIENQPIGVWLVRPQDGAVILQNSAASSIISQEEWNSTPLGGHTERFGLVHPDGTPLSDETSPVLSALRGQAVIDYEIKMHYNTPSEKDLLISSAPLLDERGKVTSAIVVMQDVTQLRRMDQRKDEFIATAAHEIRNPLAALSGYQQLLHRVTERSGAPPSVTRNVVAIGKQVERLNNLVERLLDAQRIQLGRLVLDRSPVDLHKLVESVVTDASAASEGSHPISLHLPSDELTGSYDSTRIEQVLNNFLNNAVRYSPEGSPIEVRLSRADGSAKVEVVDQGPGVPLDQREQLFDRYFQSSNQDTTGALGDGTTRRISKRKGLGLGLYISSEIVRAHRGQIGVEPNPGGGSIFWFTLPLE
jgi:signal transduction histidine kinase